MRPGVISQGDCGGYSVLRTRKSGCENGVEEERASKHPGKAPRM